MAAISKLTTGFPLAAEARAEAKPAAKAAQVPEVAGPAEAPKLAKSPQKIEAGTISKKDAVIALISRTGGATLDEIMAATGWQKHTVRGFIAILGKKGAKIESFKNEAGARTYKAA
jgi:hypothetical protein